MAKYPKEFLALCRSITAKRPRTVIDHILKHGSITTEELKNTYGYDHPPRAARDVKEHGIPLVTTRVVAANGRKIVAYSFADPNKIRFRRFSGRTAFSKQMKEALIQRYGCKCFIYLEETAQGQLQIDHRVPFEVAGDKGELSPNDFMLLCGSANRAKSWSCEHCENWQSKKDKQVCLTCYWAYPEDYSHVAMQPIRRIDLIWKGDEISQYEKLRADANASDMDIPEFVKKILREKVCGQPPESERNYP
mgnify:FL=1